MSLGRELKEFSAAFGSTLGTMNAVGAMGDRAERRKARDAANPDKSPEVQNAEKQYYKDYGVKPPASPSMALPDRSAPDFEDRVDSYRRGGAVMSFSRGGVMPDTTGYVRDRQRAISDAEPAPDYVDVPDLPYREYDPDGQQLGEGVTPLGPRSDENFNDPNRIPELPSREYDPDGQQVVDGQTPLGPRSDGSWNEPPVPQPPVDRNDPVYNAKYSQPGASNAVMPNRQAPRKDAIPPGKSQAIPTRPATGTGTGAGTGTGGARAPAAQPAKRKALNDQTRVEAYDPELDGPTEALPAAPAAVTPAGDPPKGAAGPVDYQMTGAAGEGTSPNATADYTTALDGGLKFATSTFNLNGSGAALPGTDRGANAGRQAFTKGTGAATPDMVRAIDQRVNMIPGVPNDEAIWGIRRLEAVYRFYSRRGETDKANKAVFELMQYSAGVAAKYGTAALDQLKANDQRGAVQTSVNGFNQIPNGQRAAVAGQNVVITDARTGKTVQQIPITPQTVFNVALGLSDRSLYWDQLMSRASATMKGRSTRTEAQEELTRAQIELTKKRTANVGAGRGGGGGGMSPAAQQLIDNVGKLDANYGRVPAAAPTPPAAPATAASSNDGADPEDPERGAATDDATMPLGGARPANADGQGGGESGGLAADEERYMQNRARVLAETQPKPSLRITPQRPDQAVPTSTTVEPPPAGGSPRITPQRPDQAIPASTTAEPGMPSDAAERGRVGREAALKKLPPASNAPAPANKFDPEGDGYDYETAKAAGLKPDKSGHWPSRDPKTGALLKGRKHPTSKLGDEADAARGYYTVKKEDGRYYSVNPDEVPNIIVAVTPAGYEPLYKDGKDVMPQSTPRPFDREKPDPNYLRELQKAEAAAANLPNAKERANVRTFINSRKAAYNAEVNQWNKDNRDHNTAEAKRITEARKKLLADTTAEMKKNYDKDLDPLQREALAEKINTAMGTAVEKVVKKNGSTENTIFALPDDGPLKNLTMEIMTSNPSPSADRAIAAIQAATRYDDEKPERRFYKPLGTDLLGNQVVRIEDFGVVHLRPQAYEDLTRLARTHIDGAVKRRETGPSGWRKSQNSLARSLGVTAPTDPNFKGVRNANDELDKQEQQIRARGTERGYQYEDGKPSPDDIKLNKRALPTEMQR